MIHHYFWVSRFLKLFQQYGHRASAVYRGKHGNCLGCQDFKDIWTPKESPCQHFGRKDRRQRRGLSAGWYSLDPRRCDQERAPTPLGFSLSIHTRWRQRISLRVGNSGNLPILPTSMVKDYNIDNRGRKRRSVRVETEKGRWEERGKWMPGSPQEKGQGHAWDPYRIGSAISAVMG